MQIKTILTCEHATNKLPKQYGKLFNDEKIILNSHYGLDIGAKSIARKLKPYVNDYHEANYSRLLVDLNRSIKHKNLFSFQIKQLSSKQQQKILDTIYWPYRKRIIDKIKHWQINNFIFHLSVHTFTPIFNENVRHCDIGILYDPKRKAEKRIAKKWKQILLACDSSLKIRFNYPYLGIADGFVTALRKTSSHYAGIELEVNQKYFLQEQNNKKLIKTIEKSVIILLKNIANIVDF